MVLTDETIEKLATHSSFVGFGDILTVYVQKILIAPLMIAGETLSLPFKLFLSPRDAARTFERAVRNVTYALKRFTPERSYSRSDIGREYEALIKRTFLGGKEIPMSHLVEPIQSRNLPFFVINGTAVPETGASPRVSDAIFEFTPLRFGSPNTGYGQVRQSEKWRYELKQHGFETLSEVVSISGAAVDSKATDTGGAIGISLMGANLGVHIHWKDHDALQDALVTDGGHAENLGVVSLVKRLCEEIIVVDSEYDPEYTFDGFFRLKNILESELHSNISFTRDNLLKPCSSITSFDKLWLCQRPQKLMWPFGMPIATGKIGSFPLLSSSYAEFEDVEIRLTYIKLAADLTLLDECAASFSAANQACQRAQEQYGSRLVKFFVEHEDKSFPQHPTTDQNWSTEQFLAYVDLGYRNALAHFLFLPLRKFTAP